MTRKQLSMYESNHNEKESTNELPKIENTENITQIKKKKEEKKEKKERKNSYSGQYSISTLKDESKSITKDLEGIVLYSKLKGPHNLNSYSIFNQTKKKKNSKEMKLQKRIIDNHASNSIASEVYLGKALPQIKKNKIFNNNTNVESSNKTSKLENNQEKRKEHENSKSFNDEKNIKYKNYNNNNNNGDNNSDNKNINDKKNKNIENGIDYNNNEKNKIDDYELESKDKLKLDDEDEDQEKDIFEDHDFMYILKNKKEYTVEEVLKLQDIYENENKGDYYKAYPCDDQEKMKKYKCFTQLTSKNLNTNTLTTKIRLEYLKKKKEKEEEEEKKRILWKKKVKQGYFIGRYKINRKEEKSMYERFKGALYKVNNSINRNRINKYSESLSSSRHYTRMANIRNLSFDLNDNNDNEDDTSSPFSIYKNNSNIDALPSHQVINKNIKETLLDNTNSIFKINYPYDITNSSFNNFKDMKNNVSNKNSILYINGKQINFENDKENNPYFKYVLLKKDDSLRCQSAPSLSKQQSLISKRLKTYDILFENCN